MMRTTKKLPEAELEIMLVIWEADGSVTSDYIMERLDKDWTKPTLLNLLTRLCSRGFLQCTKDGRHNLYTVLIPREAYVQEASGTLLQKLHHNSLTSLVASLYDGQKVSKADLEELKRFIEDAEEGTIK